jgi:signal transduction histidine kinase
MNPIRWQKPKWLPRFLAMPVPEPAQQASRILAFQRNIVLPARIMAIAMVFYYLFFTEYEFNDFTPSGIFLQYLQHYFAGYIIFTVVASIFLLLRRFPPRLVQWVVFTMGLVDGILLAGLTVKTDGFESTLFWVYPGLIIVNALSIPLATPQIVLNLSLSGLYLCAGLLYISIYESGSTPYSTPAQSIHVGPPTRFSASDFVDLTALATELGSPTTNEAVSHFLAGQLSRETLQLLTAGTNASSTRLQQALVNDFNRIIQSGPIFDPQRFAGVQLSAESIRLLKQQPEGTNQVRLNRRLIQDAYPHDIANNKQRAVLEEKRAATRPIEGATLANPTEPFILRLIILWLIMAACYGVQLLLFRERMSLEEERKSAARNDELRAAGRLAAEIAHQLKNPLGIINNAVFSLQRGLKEGKKDHSLQLQIIREEIEKSDRILTQLMGYAQLSEGRVEKLNIAEELDRAIAEVLPSGANYDIQVHRDYGANLPVLLMQRNHLSVVLVNLLQNAREALLGRGTIRLHAHYGDNNTVQIVIGDDGPGIPFDKLDRIFQAYVTTKEKGTGLGLAIVKHNVELYGGAVRVESELGKGARFILLFPAKTFIVPG